MHMLVTLKELLNLASIKRKAIGAFNITGLETLRAVVNAAENIEEPVILQFAQQHDDKQFITLETIGSMMIKAAMQATVPIAVHLDHGVDLPYIKRALDMGFTSIMYDGSLLSYDENILYTQIAVRMAASYGASTEAELGQMSGTNVDKQGVQLHKDIDRKMFTNPIAAKEFVEQTGVDCLACAFGSMHGLYKEKTSLDIDLVKELHHMIGAPLVMHGGSGLCEEDYNNVIENGIRKINYYTYMAKCGGEAVKEYCTQQNDPLYIHDITRIAMESMQTHIEEIIRIFRHSCKASI